MFCFRFGNIYWVVSLVGFFFFRFEFSGVHSGVKNNVELTEHSLLKNVSRQLNRENKADEMRSSCEVLDSGLSFVALSLGWTISQGYSQVFETT